jgi:hypothetical protein
MANDGEPSTTGDDGRDGLAAALDSVAMLGVHIVTDPDPSAAAQRMAEAGDVEVVADREDAQAAFAARTEAGRTAVVVIGDRERAELEAAAAISPEQTAASPDAIAAIRQQADELRRIGRIRKRTEDRFTETLSERLAAGSGLALHPDTLRTAGQAVVEVEAEIDGITRELRALETAATSAPEEAEPVTHDEPPTTRKGSRVAAIIVAAVALVAAAGVAAIGAPVIAAVVAIVGLLVALLLGRRGRNRAAEAPVAAAPPPRPRSTPQDEQARMVARARLATSLDRARERQRSVQRHWESLAGPDADAHDIDALLRLRDPQYVVGDDAARVSPTMRTVNAVNDRALDRWRAAWAALGYDDAPTVEQSEQALRVIAARPSTDPDAARVRLAAADAWTAAGTTIDRTLVLVEPDQWLSGTELTTLIAKLPAGAEVIVVQRGD